MTIGYIAAFENIVLAKMMDAGVHLQPNIFTDSEIEKGFIDYISESIFIRLYPELVTSVNHISDIEIPKNRADDSRDEYRTGWKRI